MIPDLLFNKDFSGYKDYYEIRFPPTQYQNANTVALCSEIAIQQNNARSRKLPDEIVRKTWDEVQGIKNELANLFPGGFVEIINNRAGEDTFRKAFVEVGKLIKRPPTRPAAKMWIAQELEQKKR